MFYGNFKCDLMQLTLNSSNRMYVSLNFLLPGKEIFASSFVHFSSGWIIFGTNVQANLKPFRLGEVRSNSVARNKLSISINSVSFPSYINCELFRWNLISAEHYYGYSLEVFWLILLLKNSGRLQIFHFALALTISRLT